MPERSILVFGATGALGGHLLSALTDRDVPRNAITAAGRNEARLAALAAEGFETAAVDMADAALVADLVGRHDEVVLISGGDRDRLTQHRAVIDAARASGARHLYYTSGVRADDDRFPINADHRASRGRPGRLRGHVHDPAEHLVRRELPPVAGWSPPHGRPSCRNR